MVVEGEGFEPSKLSQQIYSLPPLTARESLRFEKRIYIIKTKLNKRQALNHINYSL